MIAALYGRVSTARQEEQETIESQIAEIKARIHSDGNILPSQNIFIDDGWTGEMLIRPGLDAMRDAASDGKFQILYVYDRGRVSRMYHFQQIVIDEIVDKDIEFISLHDMQVLNAEDKAMQAMQGVFAEYERAKIAERMRRGKLYKAKNGVLINGHSLYGYNYIKKSEDVPAHYEINKEQSEVVRKIFYWVGYENVPLREVIRKLYDLGIPPRKGKSEFWTKGPIIRILQCESYIYGVVYYNKSESCVAKKPIKNVKYKKIKRTSRKARPKEDWLPYNIPVILYDLFLFEKVQKILDFNKKFARKNRKHEYLLTGLVSCDCGYGRAGDGQNKEGHFYYRCTQRIYNLPSLDKKCNLPGVNASILDNMVWNELMGFVKNPVLLRKKIEEVLRERKNRTVFKQEYQRLEGLISKIDEEEQRYAKAYGAGTLDFEQFRDLVKETKNKKKNIQDKIRNLKADNKDEGLDEIQVDDVCREANQVLNRIDYTDKARSVKTLIEKITIKKGGWVNLCGHIPLFIQKLGDEPESRDCWVA